MVSPYVHTRREKLADFNLAVERQTAKFNSLPNFPAIYGNNIMLIHLFVCISYGLVVC